MVFKGARSLTIRYFFMAQRVLVWPIEGEACSVNSTKVSNVR